MAFSPLYLCVCVCVCTYVVHSNTKTTGLVIIKLGRWIVRDKSWSSISFEVKRLNAKVTGSNKCIMETAITTHKHLPEGTAMNIILHSHNI